MIEPQAERARVLLSSRQARVLMVRFLGR